MQLSKVVGAILNDLSEAQDLANEYSRQLSYKYKPNQMVSNHENVLSNFPVPSAVLSEINLDLKFIIKEINFDGFTLDVEQTQKNCDIIASKIVKNLTEEIEQWEDLKVDQEIMTPDLINRLQISLAQDLFGLCHQVFLTGNDLAESQIQEVLTDRLDNELLKSRSIQKVLDFSELDNENEVKKVEKIREKIKEYCLSSVNKETQKNALETIIKKVKGSPKTDVIVSPMVLNKVSKETIQSLRITAKYNDSRWTISTAESTL